MPLGRGRQFWAILALCAAPVAAGFAALPQPAYAEPTPAEALKADYAAWQLEVAGVVNGANAFRNSLLPRYQCPPATPNKVDKARELSDLTMRLNRARARARAIEDRRTLLGMAGEGQLTAGRISDADMKYVYDIIRRTDTEISGLRNRLNATPPTRQDCDPKTDPIANIVFNAPSQDPGTNVRATITATTASGKALTISGIAITGLNEIGNAIGPGGLGTPNGTFDFKIADVRRQGPFTLNVTVTGLAPGFPTGAPPLSKSINVNYTVNNVAPKIEKLPDSPSAKPGEEMGLDGQIVVVDINADDRNSGEITNRMIFLDGHPAGLETTPGQIFRAFSTIKLVSHDPSKGRYTFEVSRKGNVRKPHPHGKYESTISVFDQKREKATEKIEFTVENVAPAISIQAMGRHFHSNDGKTLTVTGQTTDDNGADDIVEVEIDARPAGGGVYKLSAKTIAKDARTPVTNGFRFQIIPDQFGHINTEGKWDISAKASDDGAPEQGSPTPLVADDKTDITVDNLAPDSSAMGYLSNLEMIPGKKNVCPGEKIRVGILARDPEGDPLKVTAVIKETGATFDLAVEPGNSTYTGTVVAPAKPGKYTIEFVIEEVKTKIVTKPHKVTRTIELEVKPCEEKKDEPRTARDPAPPPDGRVAIGGPPGSQIKIGPAAPALPGELPLNLGVIFDYAKLLELATMLDNARKASGALNSDLPPLVRIVLNSFWAQFLLDRPLKAMEDGGNHPDGTCGTGSGEGPVLENPAGDNEGPKQATPFKFLEWVLSDSLEQARKDGSLPADTDWNIKANWRLTDKLDLSPGLKAEYSQWVDDIKTEQGKSAPDHSYDLRAGINWQATNNWNLNLDHEFKDWGTKLNPGNGAFDQQRYAGFLYGLTLQEGYAEPEARTQLDNSGLGTLRYVRPTIAGFTLSAEWGDSDSYDTALRFANEFGNIRVSPGSAYDTNPFGGTSPAAPNTGAASPFAPAPSPSGNKRWDDNEKLDVTLRYAGRFGEFAISAGSSYTNDAAGLDKGVRFTTPGFSNPFGAIGGEDLDSGARNPDSKPGGPIIKDILWSWVQSDSSYGGKYDAPMDYQTAPKLDIGRNKSGDGASYINDRWLLNDKWSFNVGLRYDEIEGSPAGTPPNESTLPRFNFSGGGPAYGGYGAGDTFNDARWRSKGVSFDFGGQRFVERDNAAAASGAEFKSIYLENQIGRLDYSDLPGSTAPRNAPYKYAGGVSYDPFVATTLELRGAISDNPCRTKKFAPVDTDQAR